MTSPLVQQYPAAYAAAGCQRLVDFAVMLIAQPNAIHDANLGSTYLLDRHLAGLPREALLGALQACIDKLAADDAAPQRQLYVDTVALTVLQPGQGIPRHADNCEQDASGRWVPNACSQRCLSAVLYLNEDFEGGEIVFDRQGIEIRPRTGLLIVFPSDGQYPHRVKPVTHGRRHALGIWFTAHRWHALLPQRISFAAAC